jgi:flagellin-like protein
MMTIMGKQFSRRGVSVIIAALLLIAIAVAAAVLLYVFSIGLLGSLSSSGGQQTKQQLIMEAYDWTGGTSCGAGKLCLSVRNVGSAAIVVGTGTGAGSADVFVNGVSAAFGNTGSATLVPQASTLLTITVPTFTPALTSGAAYTIKVVTPDGAVFSYSAIDGQAS